VTLLPIRLVELSSSVATADAFDALTLAAKADGGNISAHGRTLIALVSHVIAMKFEADAVRLIPSSTITLLPELVMTIKPDGDQPPICEKMLVVTVIGLEFVTNVVAVRVPAPRRVLPFTVKASLVVVLFVIVSVARRYSSAAKSGEQSASKKMMERIWRILNGCKNWLANVVDAEDESVPAW
jgi:hypothetical protein